MPTGICKLCLKTANLLRSHMMPAAMYRFARTPNKKNSNPVMMGRKVTSTTSIQVQDYLLCKDCEHLFNKNGEKWMMRQVWNGERFPLGDLCKVAMERYRLQNAVVYSGLDMGLDTGKLGYFTLSILWRAAVHEWRTPFGGTSKKLDLGPYEEPIRKYLAGQSPFPQGVVVLATICTDPASIQTFYVPSKATGEGILGTAFSFQALGVRPMVFLGSDLPPVVHGMCCVNSVKRLIFRADCSKRTFDAAFEIMRTSKLAENMKELA